MRKESGNLLPQLVPGVPYHFTWTLEPYWKDANLLEVYHRASVPMARNGVRVPALFLY